MGGHADRGDVTRTEMELLGLVRMRYEMGREVIVDNEYETE